MSLRRASRPAANVFSHTNNGTAAFNELANMASGPNSAPALGWPPLNGAETNDTWALEKLAAHGETTEGMDDFAAAYKPLSLRVAAR